MSARHNYTNPAFCQQSEFYPTPSSLKEQHLNQSNKLSQLRLLDSSLLNLNGALNDGTTISSVGVRRIQRSVSTRSFNTSASLSSNVRKQNAINRSQIMLNSTPPKPGPKPTSATNLNHSFNSTIYETTTTTPNKRSGSGRYALVPLEELSNQNVANRYAIVPSPLVHQPIQKQNKMKNLSTLNRYAKSQDNIDQYMHSPNEKEKEHHSYNEDSNGYTSLPPMAEIPEEIQPRLKAAFSSDFGSKSFVLVDHKSNQRYAMVPKSEDEDMVDDNHEVIQMRNGRMHRYAVIPTEEEEENEIEEDETCLSNDLNESLPNPQDVTRPVQSSTPHKNPFKSNITPQRNQQSTPKTNFYYPPVTPVKNPEATRRLHELLSTPVKNPNQRLNRTGERNSQRYASQQRIFNMSHVVNEMELENHYQKSSKKVSSHNETRTTAVITPRVARMDDEENGLKSQYDNSYPQKVANATMTLGVISLMLTLGSLMNSGLGIYLIYDAGRTFYLEFALAASFAGVGLGILGFRSRHCEWLPNRSFISGFILVTVFCLLKCCSLLVLLVLDPFPGIPLHDVTTGIVLGLSTFEIFFIGLGVLGSWWCYRPPPDNRVNGLFTHEIYSPNKMSSPTNFQEITPETLTFK